MENRVLPTLQDTILLVILIKVTIKQITMVERLKRWESPRKRGRNHKGKGGSARARQLRKQQQLLRKKLKENSDKQKPNQDQRREINPPSIFLSNIS